MWFLTTEKRGRDIVSKLHEKPSRNEEVMVILLSVHATLLPPVYERGGNSSFKDSLFVSSQAAGSQSVSQSSLVSLLPPPSSFP